MDQVAVIVTLKSSEIYKSHISISATDVDAKSDWRERARWYGSNCWAS